MYYTSSSVISFFLFLRINNPSHTHLLDSQQSNRKLELIAPAFELIVCKVSVEPSNPIPDRPQLMLTNRLD